MAKAEFNLDLKDILKAIEEGKANYLATRQWLHLRACEGLYHAAQHGNAQALSSLYDLVTLNDKAAFKAWVRTQSLYINEEGKERSWVKYTDDMGFQVIKGVEMHRKDKIEPVDLVATVAFFNVGKKEKVSLTKDDQALKAIASSYDDLKTIVARMDKHNIVATLEVNNAIAIIQAFFKDLKEENETEEGRTLKAAA